MDTTYTLSVNGKNITLTDKNIRLDLLVIDEETFSIGLINLRLWPDDKTNYPIQWDGKLCKDITIIESMFQKNIDKYKLKINSINFKDHNTFLSTDFEIDNTFITNIIKGELK